MERNKLEKFNLEKEMEKLENSYKSKIDIED
jgi:hypothetical protein